MMQMSVETACAKWNCAERGYLSDPYVSHFLSSGDCFQHRHRSDPSINRGYYARIRAIDAIVEEYVELCGADGAQVVVLGAGFDTGFWRRRQDSVKYYELDTPKVVAAKASAIEKSDVLRGKLGVVDRIDSEAGTVESSRYYLNACDLRDVERLERTLRAADLDFEKPTLFVAECVLAYLDPEASTAVLKWTAKNFSRALVVDYDMMAPEDAFGKIMAANFARKGWPLLSASTFKTLEDHQKRISDQFEVAHAANMDTVCSRFVLADSEERSRVSRVQIFDDPDEFKLMMEHYCLVLAGNGPEASTVVHSFTTALATEPAPSPPRVPFS